MILFYFFLLFSATPALASRSLLEKIGWHGPEWPVILAIFLVFTAIVVFLVLYYLRQYTIQKKMRYHSSERLFNDTAHQIGLSANEIQKIKQLVRHESTVEPHVIFQSITMFEKCTHKEIELLLRRRISEEEKKVENDILSNIRRKCGYHRLALEHPLISTRNIAVGQSGSLFKRNVKKPIIQKATVTDCNEFTFIIQYNVEKEEICYISKGDPIRFAFTRQSDSVYGVELMVVAADGTGCIEVGHGMDLRRNQLRQFVRIETNLAVKYRLVHTANLEKSEVGRGEIVQARIADISGGGLSFIDERSLHVGDHVLVSFDLPNASFSGIAAQVLRISLKEGKSRTLFKHHIQFQNLEPRKRDMIVKYVFEKQRQMNQWR